MKPNQILKTCGIILFILSTLPACSLVDLEEPGPTTPVEPPAGIPLTEEEFIFELAATDDSRMWSALTFQLEGLNGFQFCRLDDTFIFFSNGTYRYDGGEVLCGGEDNTRIKTGIWELSFQDSQIIFDRQTSKEYRTTVAGLENGRMELTGQVEIFGQSLDISGIYETEQ